MEPGTLYTILPEEMVFPPDEPAETEFHTIRGRLCECMRRKTDIRSEESSLQIRLIIWIRPLHREQWFTRPLRTKRIPGLRPLT